MQTEFDYLVVFKFDVTRRAISKVRFTNFIMCV